MKLVPWLILAVLLLPSAAAAGAGAIVPAGAAGAAARPAGAALAARTVGAAAMNAASATTAVPAATERTPTLSVEQQGKTTNIFVAGDDAYVGVIRKVQALRQDGRTDSEMLSYIEQHRNDLPPPYYLEAVRRSCKADPKAALGWLALYALRSRYDAFRCTDETASSNVQATLVWLQVPECQAYLDLSRPSMQASFKVAAAQPDLFESRASPWWICSGGMGQITQGLEAQQSGKAAPSATNTAAWLRPESEWPAIRKKLLDAIDKP